MKILTCFSFRQLTRKKLKLFFRHEIIKLPDKVIMENCLFISESINFNLPYIFNHWFTFSSDSHN